MWSGQIVFLTVVFTVSLDTTHTKSVIEGGLQWISEKTLQDIADHQSAANMIIDLAVSGKAQNQSYNRLADFTDKFGSRLAGTKNLENAIDYMLQKLKEDGLENVHGEEAKVPHWVRGEESLVMLEPRYHPMALLGLGSSVGTPPNGIKGEVLVVRSFDELHSRASEAKGKIIVYNQAFVSYGDTVQYRTQGASEAAKVGGLASLIRSVTPYSIYSPHTGWQDYEANVKKIPTACITVEDAEMMDRMQQRGKKIVVHLNMSAQNLPMKTSRNTVAEIVGSKYPDQVVLVSGHLDSWDVGQGAMDDGGGAFISWQVLSLVKLLGLRPKRTLRLVMWTGEEEGLFGSQQYYKVHKVNISNFDLVMESDLGTFTPHGVEFAGNTAAQAIMKEVIKPLESIGTNKLFAGASGPDIDVWISQKVPGVSLRNGEGQYFNFHHSNGDTMTVQDPHAMDLCSALWAVVAYTVADLEDMLPRDS